MNEFEAREYITQSNSTKNNSYVSDFLFDVVSFDGAPVVLNVTVQKIKMVVFSLSVETVDVHWTIL